MGHIFVFFGGAKLKNRESWISPRLKNTGTCKYSKYHIDSFLESVGIFVFCVELDT
jgi:hypothetical protein